MHTKYLLATCFQLTNHMLFPWQNSCHGKHSVVSTLVVKFLTPPTDFCLQHINCTYWVPFFFFYTKKLETQVLQEKFHLVLLFQMAHLTNPIHCPGAHDGWQSSHLHFSPAFLLASCSRAVSLALPSKSFHHTPNKFPTKSQPRFCHPQLPGTPPQMNLLRSSSSVAKKAVYMLKAKETTNLQPRGYCHN